MTDAPIAVESTKAAFRPGVILALVLAAVLSMLAMAVMSAWAPEFSDGNDGRDHALSKSATGYAGVVSLLRGVKHLVVLSRGPLRGAGPDSLLILTPPSGRDEKQMNALIQHKGAVLIVLPKWRTAPDPLRRGWVRTLGLASPGEALSVLPKWAREGVRLDPDRRAPHPVVGRKWRAQDGGGTRGQPAQPGRPRLDAGADRSE